MSVYTMHTTNGWGDLLHGKAAKVKSSCCVFFSVSKMGDVSPFSVKKRVVGRRAAAPPPHTDGSLSRTAVAK